MPDKALRGVNLGGWFIVEKLTTPSIFNGVLGRDETSLIKELGDASRERLKKHHQEYITESDFKWLAEHGINAIRLPVPHWAFGDVEPYVGCIKQIDWAMDMSKKYGLQVLLDLHTAPGSQNGQDHSGREGSIEWHTGAGNITQTVEILERLAFRYGKYPNLWGIELLNEPGPKIPLGTLQEFYRLAYEKLRAICDNSVVIVMHDSFRPEQWGKFFAKNAFDNVALDMHIYQIFSAEDKRYDAQSHLKKALRQRDLLETVQLDVQVIVGEWSLGLPPKAFRALDTWEADKARQAFGTIQLNTFQKTQGWFFWSYKTEDLGGWNFRYSVEKGWLPPNFDEEVVIETIA